MNSLKTRFFRTCPKSGRIVGVRQPEGWARLLFPLIGLAALVWFLVRVVPKPSRAVYPCQQVAIPLATGFVVWLGTVTGASILFHKNRGRSEHMRHLTTAFALVAALVGASWAVINLPQLAQAGSAPEHIER